MAVDADILEQAQEAPPAVVTKSANPMGDVEQSIRNIMMTAAGTIFPAGGSVASRLLSAAMATKDKGYSADRVADMAGLKKVTKKEILEQPGDDDAKQFGTLQWIHDAMSRNTVDPVEIKTLFDKIYAPSMTRRKASLTPEDLDNIRFMNMGDPTLNPISLAARIKESKQYDIDEQDKEALAMQLLGRERAKAELSMLLGNSKEQIDMLQSMIPGAMQLALQDKKTAGMMPKYIGDMISKSGSIKNADDQATNYRAIATALLAEASKGGDDAAFFLSQAQAFGTLAKNIQPNANEGLTRAQTAWYINEPEIKRLTLEQRHGDAMARINAMVSISNKNILSREKIAAMSKQEKGDTIKIITALKAGMGGDVPALAEVKSLQESLSQATKSIEAFKSKTGKYPKEGDSNFTDYELAKLAKSTLEGKIRTKQGELATQTKAKTESLRLADEKLQELLLGSQDDGQGNLPDDLDWGALLGGL